MVPRPCMTTCGNPFLGRNSVLSIVETDRRKDVKKLVTTTNGLYLFLGMELLPAVLWF